MTFFLCRFIVLRDIPFAIRLLIHQKIPTLRPKNRRFRLPYPPLHFQYKTRNIFSSPPFFPFFFPQISNEKIERWIILLTSAGSSTPASIPTPQSVRF
jgi:hypothetical protein